METCQDGKCLCGIPLPDYPLLCGCGSALCLKCHDTCVNCSAHTCFFCTVISPSGHFCSVCSIFCCDWCLEGQFKWVGPTIGCIKHVLTCPKGHMRFKEEERFKDFHCVGCEEIVCDLCIHNEIQGKRYCEKSLRKCTCGSMTSNHIPSRSLKYRGHVIVERGCHRCVDNTKELIQSLLIASQRHSAKMPFEVILMILRYSVRTYGFQLVEKIQAD